MRGFLRSTDIHALEPIRWLIEPLIIEGSFTLLYGPPGTGKTFLALDMALSIGTGRDFHGHRALHGPFAYILAEGIGGLSNRIKVWELTRQPAENDYFYPYSLNLRYQTETEGFLRLLRTIPTPKLIVIDTIARCFAGGDENSVEEMSTFVSHVDQIRDATSATVISAHHSTKADQTRERGSSALLGSVDAALSLVRVAPGIVRLSCLKQRDAEPFDPILFALAKTLINEERSSIAFRRITVERPQVQGVGEVQEGEGGKLTARQRILAHWERTGNPGTAEELGMPSSTYFKAKNKLIEMGLMPVH